MKPMCNEMCELVNLLNNAEIPFEVANNLFGATQLFYPSKESCAMDVICHPGSYGYESGLLEIMWHVPAYTEDGYESDEEVQGWLDGNAVANLIADYEFFGVASFRR